MKPSDPKPKRLPTKKVTLLALAVRVARLERQMEQVSAQAGHAYIHTMRIGGQ